jgi:MoaA/NifB/PqqE/SkfB family radical SAM enzyme
MQEHVPYYLQHQYNLYDRTKKSGIRFSCNLPEKVLSIDNQGNCFLCICDGWLPVSVGHIMSFNTIEEVWQSPIAKALHKDIVIDKNFTWCSVDYCGIRDQNKQTERYLININIDESCNLQCPTCRSQYMNFTKGPIYDKKLKWADHIVELLKTFNNDCTITMSGNGDPFASLIYRPMLMNTVVNVKHQYRIMTNGLLLKKLLKKSSIYKNIKEYSISIDAGDTETYERVRLKGKWNVLIENLDFLKQELIDQKDISVVLNFCLHKENLSSLKNFVELLEKYQWQGNVQALEHWGAYDQLKFNEQNLMDKNHKDYETAIELLKSISTNKRVILTSNLYNNLTDSADKK